MNANPTVRPLHVLWVEDHPLFRQGLAELVHSRLPEVRCEAVASAGQALARLQGGEPPIDWLLTDLRLPDRDGWQLLAEVRHRWPALPCAVVSGEEMATAVERARQWGCRGFVPKSLEPAALCEVLRRLFAGERHFVAAAQAQVPSGVPQLTARQQAVLQGLARGWTSKVIAEHLGIAERTVKDHLSVLYGRLDAGTRAEAVARAAALGLLDPAEPGGAASVPVAR